MKRVNDDYFKILMYVFFGLILVISSYTIIINIRHYQALSYKVVVNEADVDYINYKKNISDIEDNLNRNNKTLPAFTRTLNVLKNGGVFRLLPQEKLTYRDLYSLNDYFINDIIDDCWMSSLKEINKNKVDDQSIMVLVNNAKYLNNHFINNGLALYDSGDENIIHSDYEMILKNYLSFSNILLTMSEK